MYSRQSKFKRHALYVFAVSVCVLLLLCAALPVSADTFKDDENTVTVGYYENEVFQEGAAENTLKTGYAYEYYRKMSEYTGWRYKYVYGSFSELYQGLLDGKIDLLAGLARTEEREDLILYPDAPMGSETYALVKHKEAEKLFLDASSLKGRKIGVLNSAMVNTLNKFIEDHGYDVTVLAYADYDSMFKEFDERRIDLIMTEGDGAYGRRDAEVLCTFGASDYYLCVSKARPDLLEKLNAAQTSLAEEDAGYLVALNSKYYSISMASRTFSQDEKDWIEAHDELNVGYLENYLPFSATDRDGKPAGMVSDLVPKILESVDMEELKVDYKGYESYKAMIDAINTGEIDVAFPVGGGLYFSEENGINQSKTVVSPPPELVYYGEYNENQKLTFAVYENNMIQSYYIMTHFPEAEYKYYDTIDACLKAVKSKEVDCTLVSGLRAHDISKSEEYSELSFSQLAMGDDHCFGVSIGNDGLLKLINRGISIVGSDYIQNMANRYSSGLYNYGPREFIRDNRVAIFLISGLIIALVIFLLVRDTMRKRRQIARTEAARSELEEKNTELAESREALSDALTKAERASHAKTAFLNNMSHDIRTPMNAIVGFTFMAQKNLENNELVEDYLGKISVSSHHLLSLINDVLDMSRIESGSMEMDEAEVHMPDLVHELWMIIQSNVSEKKINLFLETRNVVNEDVITDKLRLNQVLLNILSNAVKFTPEGGTINFIVIQLPCEDEGVALYEFRVRDNGIGMSEEFKESIFDAFTREQTSTVSGIQGTGLGMAITKNIVDMMGGTVEVQSVKGEGTEFTVRIPCKICESHDSEPELAEFKDKRVLIADDDAYNCDSICSMLETLGMKPEYTSCGADAVARAEKELGSDDPYAVYILDMVMPDMNGIEAARHIREAVGDSVPIILATAYDYNKCEEEAKQAGITAFCSKPLFLSELREVLSNPFRESAAKDDDSEPAEPDFTGKRILLAEDNEMNRMIAVSILEGAGFEVDIAENGELAVNKVKEAPAGRYDAVLMDIQMPVMDGYTAAKLIRSMDDPEKAGIPIVAVTANAFDEDRKIALEVGMNGHLAKPYDIPAMMELLKELLCD